MDVCIVTLIDNNLAEVNMDWSPLVSERQPDSNSPVTDLNLERTITITGSADDIIRMLVLLKKHNDPEVSHAADLKLQSFLGEYCELISGDVREYED